VLIIRRWNCINLLKPSGFFTYHHVQHSKNSTWSSLCVECFVRTLEKTATFALNVINWLVFIAVVESVYSAVRTDSLYTADYVWSLNSRGGKCLQRGTDWFLYIKQITFSLQKVNTASGIFHSQPAHRKVTYTEYYTRRCINTIRPPDDEHSVARNM